VGLKLNNLTEVLKINENDPGDKRGQYFQKTNDGKQIFRDMMSRYIPADIIQAEKQGFSAPDSSWFKGESIEFVRRKLVNCRAQIYEVLDRQAVVPLIEQHLTGQQNRRLLIWSLLNIETYLQECM
jgi:asparagine synthase (glutamine-hydrolysing)